MIYHRLFRLGGANRVQAHSISGVTVSHLVVRADGWAGNEGSLEALYQTEGRLSVTLRKDGRQALLINRMRFPEAAAIADMQGASLSLALDLGNLRLSGSDTLVIQAEVEDEILGPPFLEFALVDSGKIANDVRTFEKLENESSFTAKAPRRIWAIGHGALDDIEFELRFGGQQTSISFPQAKVLRDLMADRIDYMRTIPGIDGLPDRRERLGAALIYSDQHSHPGVDVSGRILGPPGAVTLYVERSADVAGDPGEARAEAARRIRQAQQTRGEEGAREVAARPAVLPQVLPLELELPQRVPDSLAIQPRVTRPVAPAVGTTTVGSLRDVVAAKPMVPTSGFQRRDIITVLKR